MGLDLKPGDPLPVLPLAVVGGKQVLAYVTCAGDDNPIHVDEAAAGAAGLAGLVLPGMLIAAQFPRLLQLWKRNIRLTDITVQFLAPLGIDQAFVVTGKVVAIDRNGAAAIVRMTARAGTANVAMAEARIVQE